MGSEHTRERKSQESGRETAGWAWGRGNPRFSALGETGETFGVKTDAISLREVYHFWVDRACSVERIERMGRGKRGSAGCRESERELGGAFRVWEWECCSKSGLNVQTDFSACSTHRVTIETPPIPALTVPHTSDSTLIAQQWPTRTEASSGKSCSCWIALLIRMKLSVEKKGVKTTFCFYVFFIFVDKIFCAGTHAVTFGGCLRTLNR